MQSIKDKIPFQRLLRIHELNCWCTHFIFTGSAGVRFLCFVDEYITLTVAQIPSHNAHCGSNTVIDFFKL